ncbi:MAG: hypothetical protein EBW79_06385 [Actinobacteria bacterium]|nr:hypothetical protein [Actinomycetota bacterium]
MKILIYALGLALVYLAPAEAAAPTSQCRFSGDTQVKSGTKYACLFYKGKSTWINVPKVKTSKLNQYERTKLKAYTEIRKQISTSEPKNIRLQFFVSDNFPKDLRTKYVAQINLSTRLYDQFFAPETPINVYLQTEKDEEFIDSTPILSRQKQDYANFLEYWRMNQGTSHVLGLVANFTEYTGKPEGHTGVILSSKTNAKSVQIYSEQVVPHEYFHVVQDYFKYKRDQVGYADDDEIDAIYPPIFREGSANTISTALGMGSFETYLLFYRVLVAQNKGDGAWPPFNTLTKKENVIAALKSIELRSNNPTINMPQFVLGSLVFEWLIAEYGFDAFKKLIYNQSLNINFEENLKLSLGITKDRLYDLSSEHIIQAFKFPLPR